MKLYLHIGTGRTGTQALQDYLKRNADVLRDNGIYYPILERKNHHNALALPICGKTPPRYLKSRYGDDFKENVEAFHHYFDKLEGMIKVENLEKVVLSSEFLGRSFSNDLGAILFDRLQRIFSDITIIVYFRTPASYFLSSALQTLKASKRFNHPFKQQSQKILKSYEPLGSKFVPREYNRDVLHGNDICSDFIHTLDPKLVPKLKVPSKQKNETLSAEVMSIIQDYREQIWPNSDNEFNTETNTLLDRLVTVAYTHGLYVKPRLKPEIEAALNQPEDEMLWLRDHYGLTFAGIDYDQERSSKMKLEGKFTRVEDICVLNHNFKNMILIQFLSDLNKATLREVGNATASTPTKPGKSENKWPKPVEIKRLKATFPCLRRPEIEHYAKPSLVLKTRKTGLIRIRGNFPDVRIDDITSWNFNPQNHVVWRIYFNSFAWISVLAKETENQKLDADWELIKRLVWMFLDHFDEHVDKPKSDIWDDHATGYRASYLAWLYAGGLVDHLNGMEDRRLRKAMHLHREKLMTYLDSGRWKYSNHTLFQAEGLADLAMVFLINQDRRDQTLEFAAAKIDEFVRNAVTQQEGTVKEHSMFYHVFLMGRLVDTCSYFEAAGYPIGSATDEMFTKMNQFLHDIMPVSGRLPGIGDSKHHQKFDKKYVKAFEGERFSNKRILYHQTNGEQGTKYRFMTTYPSDGYFIFRSDAPQNEQLYSVLLHRTFRGPHGHWDGGSFICYKNGHPVLIDSGGPYMYSTPMRYKYFVTALAHNALIFDNDPVQLSTKLLDTMEGETFAAVALAAEMGGGRFWIRLFAQDANYALFMVDIPTATTKGHTAELRFHIDPHVAISGREMPELSGEWGKAVFSHSSLALDTAVTKNIPSLLDSARSTSVVSNRVAPEDRGKRLDHDFDKRSYVTYKDNEMQQSQIYRRAALVDQATLTCLSFETDDAGYSMTLEENTLNVIHHNGIKKAVTLSFSLSNLLFIK